MKLRGKFAIFLAVTAVVPLLVAAVVLGQVISRGYQAKFESDMDNYLHTANYQLAQLQSELSRAANAQSNIHAHYVGGVLLDHSKFGAQLPMQSRKRVSEQGRPLMLALGVDAMVLVDGSGTVLDAPHFLGQIGESGKKWQALAKAASRSMFSHEPVMTDRGMKRQLFLWVAQTTSDFGFDVTVALGRKIDETWLSGWSTSPSGNARIVAQNGETLVPSSKPWQKAATFRLPLPGQEQAALGYLELTIDRKPLEQVLFRVTLTTIFFATLSLFIAVGLGWLVATRMTRNIEALTLGAHAISQGDLSQKVLVQGKDEVATLGHAFNHMASELKDSKERLAIAERVAAWQEIARRLAHEIKNPLTPIQISMDNMRKAWQRQHPEMGEILQESTGTVLEEVNRLKRIVTEFAEFARLPKPVLTKLALDQVIESALPHASSDWMTLALAAGNAQVYADRDQLIQTILNLVENAREATNQRENPRVVVRSGLVRGNVFFSVDDNGPGVPAELRERIFTPYFTTKEAKGGSGLGLAIVHRIVVEHSGKIALTESELGGACFLVELPLINS